ncbi:MAG: hypothetical protein ABW136_03330 [Steroidobacteraceae bacterium]
MELDSRNADDVEALRSHLTSYLYGMRTLDETSLTGIAELLEPYTRSPHSPRTWLKAAKVRDLFKTFCAQRPIDRRMDQRIVWKLKVSILQFCAAALRLDQGHEPKFRPQTAPARRLEAVARLT